MPAERDSPGSNQKLRPSAPHLITIGQVRTEFITEAAPAIESGQKSTPLNCLHYWINAVWC